MPVSNTDIVSDGKPDLEPLEVKLVQGEMGGGTRGLERGRGGGFETDLSQMLQDLEAESLEGSVERGLGGEKVNKRPFPSASSRNKRPRLNGQLAVVSCLFCYPWLSPELEG